MRYKPEQKTETHDRIVETAGREFRAKGYEAVGISKLMSLLNLTHGGFYAHFEDKEDLIVEASQAVLDETLAILLAELKSGGFAALLNYYLSNRHRDNAEFGCLLPSLSPEIARRQTLTREAYTGKLAHILDAVADYMLGPTPERRLEKVTILFASMVGAVSLARAVSDSNLSESILTSTREHLLKMVDAD